MKVSSVCFLFALFIGCTYSRKDKMHINSKLLIKRSGYIDNKTKIEYFEVDSNGIKDLEIQFDKIKIKGREIEIYNVENGVLVKGMYGFLLYKSVQDLEAVSILSQGQNYLTGLNPYDDDIFLHENEMMKKLCKKINFDVNKLDKSEESLYLLDSSLEEVYVDDDFIEQYFMPIFLYAGEVAVKTGAVKWKLNYLEREKLWEPIILDNKGREISFGLPLMEYFEQCEGKVLSGLLLTNHRRVLYMAQLP